LPGCFIGHLLFLNNTNNASLPTKSEKEYIIGQEVYFLSTWC
jgi:hypothetical protein